MKILKLIILVLLILMSIAAGVAKVMQMPQEIKFFEDVGIGLGLLIPFGILQILGAILAAIPKTRPIGCLVMALVFLASAVMIFISGNVSFGLVSLIPAALAGFCALGKSSQTMSYAQKNPPQ